MKATSDSPTSCNPSATGQLPSRFRHCNVLKVCATPGCQQDDNSGKLTEPCCEHVPPRGLAAGRDKSPPALGG